MSEKVSFVINLEGTAYKGVLQLDSAVKNIVDSVNAAQDGFKRIGNFIYTQSAKKIAHIKAERVKASARAKILTHLA